jgi:hypothetical protein
MRNLLINLILFLAGAYIFYTIYDTQLKDKREPMEIINPQEFNDDSNDYILNHDQKHDVIPFDSGIRVNNFLTCSKN